jgi:hypothetical protein
MILVRPRAIALSVAFASLTFASTSPARAGNACVAAYEANLGLHSYRTTLRTPAGTQTTVDLVIPDRFHVIGKGMEMISVGNRTWMRTGSAGWSPMPGAGMNTAAIFAMARQQMDVNKAGNSCVDAGLGSYAGRPAHVFKFSRVGPNGPSSGKLYVFPDGYVHHLETSSPQGPIEVDFSKFNSVAVSPP